MGYNSGCNENYKLIEIGKIISVVGLNGEVKIACYMVDPYNVEVYQIVDRNGDVVSIRLSHVQDGEKRIQTEQTTTGTKPIKSMFKFSKNGWLVVCNIDGITSRSAAQKLVGVSLFVKRCELPSASEDEWEFYYADIIGLSVIDDETNNVIGYVMRIHDMTAYDLLEIKITNDEDSTIPSSKKSKNVNKSAKLRRRNKNNSQSHVLMHIFNKDYVKEVNIQDGYIRIFLDNDIEINEQQAMHISNQ